MNDKQIKSFKRCIEEMIKAKIQKEIAVTWNGLTINFSYGTKTGIIRYSKSELSNFNSLYRPIFNFC